MKTAQAISLTAVGSILAYIFTRPGNRGGIKGLGNLAKNPTWNEFRYGKPLHYKGFNHEPYIAYFKDNSDVGLFSLKITDPNGRTIRNVIMTENEIYNFHAQFENEGSGLGSLGAARVRNFKAKQP